MTPFRCFSRVLCSHGSVPGLYVVNCKGARCPWPKQIQMVYWLEKILVTYGQKQKRVELAVDWKVARLS